MQLEKIKIPGLDLNGVELTLPHEIKMQVLTERGPRIIGLSGPKFGNLLLVDENNKFCRGSWSILGGHRVWPHNGDADETESAYHADNGECAVSNQENSVTFWGEIVPDKTCRGIEIKLGGDSIEVTSLIQNVSDAMLWGGGIWALTCVTPKSREIIIPLGKGHGAKWDNYPITFFRAWAGHTSPSPGHRQFRLGEYYLTIKPEVETKITIRNDQGWMAMNVPDEVLFAKKIQVDPKLLPFHPGGSNFAFYNSGKCEFSEMETMGPWTRLEAGQTIRHTERWYLTDPLPENVELEPSMFDFLI